MSLSLLIKVVQCGLDHTEKLYIQEISLQLKDPNCYFTCRDDPIICNNLIVKAEVSSINQKEAFPKKSTNLWVYVSNLDKPCLYLLRKTHKPNNIGRPSFPPASAPHFIYQSFLDSIFQPLVTELPSLVKILTTPLEFSNLLDSSRTNPVTFSSWICVLFTHPCHAPVVWKHFSSFLTGELALSPLLRLWNASQNLYSHLPPSRLTGITLARLVASLWAPKWVIVMFECSWATLNTRSDNRLEGHFLGCIGGTQMSVCGVSQTPLETESIYSFL